MDTETKAAEHPEDTTFGLMELFESNVNGADIPPNNWRPKCIGRKIKNDPKPKPRFFSRPNSMSASDHIGPYVKVPVSLWNYTVASAKGRKTDSELEKCVDYEVIEFEETRFKEPARYRSGPAEPHVKTPVPLWNRILASARGRNSGTELEMCIDKKIMEYEEKRFKLSDVNCKYGADCNKKNTCLYKH
jgi:hypothetical protein